MPCSHTGSRARWIADEARRCGFPAGRIVHAEDVAELVQALLPWVRLNSVLLVKGSRGMRMESIIEALRGDGSWTFGH